MQIVDVLDPSQKLHYDLATLVETTARTLARAGLAHDRKRPPPNDEWETSEWDERILQCIPGAEEKHARNVAKAIVHDIKRVLLPPPPALMVIEHPPTYEELAERVKRLEAAIKPITAEIDRIDPPVGEKTIGDNVEIWQSGGPDITRSKLTYGVLRNLRSTEREKWRARSR